MVVTAAVGFGHRVAAGRTGRGLSRRDPSSIPFSARRNVPDDMEEFGPIIKKQGKVVNYEYPPVMRLGKDIPVIIKIGKKSYQAKRDWITDIEQEG